MNPVCESEEKLVLAFEGSLDTAKCVQIEAEVRRAVAEANTPVTFDLERADFVSSSFLRLCIAAYKQAGDRGFQILHASPSVKRVFKIAGLDSMLKGEHIHSDGA